MEVQAEQFRNRKLLRADSFENDNLAKKKKAKVSIKKTIAAKLAPKPGAVSKKKKKKKKLFKKIGGGIKKAAKAVGKAVKKIAVISAAAPLLPFKGLMKKALKKKGVAAPKKFDDLIEVFYNNIVKKSSNFESHPMYGRTLERDGYNDDHIIGEIVSGVLNFITGLIRKKKEQKAGSPVELSPVEDAIANEAQHVLKTIDKKAADAGIDTGIDMPGSSSNENDGSDTESVSERRGGKGGDNSKLLLIGAAAVGAFLLLKK